MVTFAAYWPHLGRPGSAFPAPNGVGMADKIIHLFQVSQNRSVSFRVPNVSGVKYKLVLAVVLGSFMD